MHPFWAVQPVQFAVSTFYLVFGQKHREMETAQASGAGDCVHLLSLPGQNKTKQTALHLRDLLTAFKKNSDPTFPIDQSLSRWCSSDSEKNNSKSMLLPLHFFDQSKLTTRTDEKFNSSDWWQAGLVKSILTAQLTQCLGGMLCVWSGSSALERRSLCWWGS